MILSIRGILSALILDILGKIWGIFAMADPDLQIRGGGGHPDAEIGAGGGGGLKRHFFGTSGLSLVQN